MNFSDLNNVLNYMNVIKLVWKVVQNVAVFLISGLLIASKKNMKKGFGGCWEIQGMVITVCDNAGTFSMEYSHCLKKAII